jgi:site-specific recombinase XerD
MFSSRQFRQRRKKLLSQFLGDDPNAFLFSPVASEKTRLGKVSRRRSKVLRSRYDTDSYRQAINYGFDKAKRAKVEIPHWHPNQLRHLIATEIDQSLGRQASQRWLGHACMDATAIYAQQQVKELVSIARELDRQWATQSAPEQLPTARET